MGTASGEERHQPNGAPGWVEVFQLEYWQHGGDLGGFARIEIRPDDGVSWFWTSLVGRDRKLVTVLEFGADVPRWPGVELRGPSLWAELVVETPWEHVSFGLEAFAVELTTPEDVFDGCRGDLVPMGYDLEWESDPAQGGIEPTERAYTLDAVAHGEILVGSEAIEFTGAGRRGHWWGIDPESEQVARPSGLPWAPVQLPDGSRRAWVLDRSGPFWTAVSR